MGIFAKSCPHPYILDESAENGNLPITVFIHNDETWGFPKTTQEVLFNKTAATDLGMIRYDKMVEVLGGVGEFVTELSFIESGIAKARETRLPACINIVVDKDAQSPGVNFLNGMVKERSSL